jgi:hypothetical protein
VSGQAEPQPRSAHRRAGQGPHWPRRGTFHLETKAGLCYFMKAVRPAGGGRRRKDAEPGLPATARALLQRHWPAKSALPGCVLSPTHSHPQGQAWTQRRGHLSSGCSVLGRDTTLLCPDTQGTVPLVGWAAQEAGTATGPQTAPSGPSRRGR